MIARLALALTFLSLQPAWAASRIYSIDSNASSVQAHVGKTGIGSFAGHEHQILAPSLQGDVNADFEDLARSTVEVLVNARAMTVSEEGEPKGDAPKVQQGMRGLDVFHVAHFPLIR